MADNKIPQRVLSEALQEAIAERRVKVAVFLTYQFDPGFFELEILPLLFSQSFSHVPKVRLLQLEEALRTIDHLAVYYDRRALTADAQPARLDYRRIGVARRTGVFHPKNILLLVENVDEVEARTWDSLIFVTLSANLTQSGWWENVECVHVEALDDADQCSFRDALLALISRLKQEDRVAGEEHAALESIRTFVRVRLVNPYQWTRQRHWKPRLYEGQQPVPDFLAEFVSPGEYNLEVISPYFDGKDSAGTLDALIRRLQPKETRIWLPRGKSAEALCSPEFFAAVAGLPRVHWAQLPAEVVRSSESDKNAPDRFVHAKVYRLWKQEDNRDIYFIGSVNLTQAAHSRGGAGNFETAVLIEPESGGRLTWWLAREEDRPRQFRAEPQEDVAPDEAIYDVSLRFDWMSGRLDYYWESSTGQAPRRAEVAAQGVDLFGFDIRLDTWGHLPGEHAEIVRRLLVSTSFVEVCADGGPPFRVLVREEGMAHKPSLLRALTVEEILQYWSLLSPEQREVFLSERIPDLSSGGEHIWIDETKRPAPESMFDRFAGIFHAFGRLEHHVREALDANRHAEAVYRLFGEKYDSLPALIHKVVEDREGDLVNRYVTLLCAKQLLDNARTEYPDFCGLHRDELKRVSDLLAEIDKLEAQFTFDAPDERAQFFRWFTGMFFLHISGPETEEHAG